MFEADEPQSTRVRDRAEPSYKVPSRPATPMEQARPELVVHDEGGVDEGLRGEGIRDVLGGIALVCVGFLWGSSVFLGNPTPLDWVFDGLGTFWVVRGIIRVVQSS